MAKQNGGRAAGIEIHDVGQAQQDTEKWKVQAVACNGCMPGERAQFAFEAQPIDVMIVAESEELQLKAEWHATELKTGSDFVNASSQAPIDFAGMSYADVVGDDVVLDQVGQMVVSLRSEPHDLGDFFGEPIAMAVIGFVFFELGAFGGVEGHTEIVNIRGEDSECAFEFAQVLNAILAADERFHPADDIENVALIVERIERHVSDHCGEKRR